MDGRCEQCRFWQETHRATMTYRQQGGECRRYPATIHEHGVAAWFITSPRDWCGEFKAQAPEEEEESGYHY